MSLRQQTRHNDNLAALLEKRRQAKENALDSRVVRLREMSQRFNESMSDIVRSANNLNELMQKVSTGAQETNRAVNTNMRALTQMNENAGSMIEAMQYSSGNIEKIREEVNIGQDHIKQLEKMVDEAARYSEEEAQAVAQLKEEARKIENIVALVKKIADETNLLALNAAIEASRAGEHGRGFAVVADEVRSLAEFSEQTTHRINKAIENSLDYLNRVTVSVENFRKAALGNQRKSTIITGEFDTIESLAAEAISCMASLTEAGNKIKELTKEAMKEGEEIGGATEEISASSEETTRSTMEEASAIKSIDAESEQMTMVFNELKHDGSDQEMMEMLRANLDTVSAAVEEVNSSSFEIKKAIEEIHVGSELIENSVQTLESTVIQIENLNQDCIRKMQELADIRVKLVDSLERIKAIDHELYIENLQKAIENKTLFEGELDPTRCAFGLWHTHYRPKDEHETQSYKSIKTPHDQVHMSARKIVHFMEEEAYDQAWMVLREEVKPTVHSFYEAFKGWGMRDGLAFIITGIARSKNLNDETLQRLSELRMSFGEILKVVDVISRVTIQINMLAVNGAIEAARAGEYGRGFAVVAGDIRNMAKESEKNSNTIKEMLEIIHERVEEIFQGFESVTEIAMRQSERAEACVESMMRIVNVIESTDKTFASAFDVQQGMTAIIERVKTDDEQIRRELQQLLASRVPAEKAVNKLLEGLEQGMHLLNDQIALFEEMISE